MAENDETSDKNLSSSENTKTSQQIEESQNMSNDLKKLEGKIYRYNREEMLEIRENKFSRTRPKELSKEFDNEDGFFSPDKWLQHQWQCEGVENRGGKRSKATTVSGVSALPIGLGTSKVLGAIFEAASNNNNGLDQQMILSPQRRGFSSGCRASSPSRNNDEEKTSSSKSRWRQGQLSNGVDFKPAFQKSALEANSRSSRSSSSQNNATNIAGGGNSNSWTTMFGSAKHNWEKDKNRRGGEQRERNRYSTNTDSEPIPEWMNDGPTSHLDVIELKGFDDDSGGAGANTGNEKNQKRRRSKGKEPSIGPKSSNKSRGRRGSREKSKGRAGSSPRSSTRPKRHSSGDIGTNKNNCSNSRPSSRNTPSQSNCAERKNSFPAATKFIQASELESFIIMEQQEKLNQEKMKDGNGNMFDLFSTLGIEPPKQKQKIAKESEEKQNKIPNSDAEFAAYILDVPANQIAKPISGTNPEPTSSRFSRFFAKDPDDKKTGKSIKDDKLLTKSQLDISSIATHYQGHAAAGRQSSSPPNNMLGSSGHLRPASAELQRSSPLVLRQQSPNLMKIVGIHPQMQNKFPGMPFGPNMSPAEFNVAAEREAVFQQMQAANFSTGNLASQHFSPSPIQFQQQQFLNQLRKRASPIMPMSTLFPGAARPSSVEHPHQMLSSPMFPHQQRQSPLPQMHMPPYASSSSNGSGHLPIHFQHLMIETARRMQPNPNIAPGPEHIRAAYFELLSKDPKMRHYIQMNPNAHNQFELPIGFGNGSFPIGNPPPFHSPHLFTGSVGPPAPPFNHGPGGMHGQFGFPPPTGPFPSHMQHPFGGQPSFFQQHQQFSNMNPPPPFPPPNVHQQGPKPTNTLLNTTAFTPTSVMRQMSKMPGGSSSGGNGDSFDLGSSSNTSSTMFLQKLFGETNSAKAGRAILGRDPDEGLPRNVPRISGCMKLEDIEQRELAALQQQQSSSHNPILASPLGLANENANFL